MKLLNTNSQYRFRYNPFGNLTDRDVPAAIVARPFVSGLVEQLEKQSTVKAELVGDKGRGKTTHLRLLQQLFPDAIFFGPSKPSHYQIRQLLQAPPDRLLLMDSIHCLTLPQRFKIYRHFQRLILSTHRSRQWEYLLSGQHFQSFRLKGLPSQTLTRILENRIRLATASDTDSKIQLEKTVVQSLCQKYKDDTRAILNHLYDQFAPASL